VTICPSLRIEHTIEVCIFRKNYLSITYHINMPVSNYPNI
jgi:hypothetical protein